MKRLNKGMSLMELIIYVGIFVIFIVGVITVAVEAMSIRVKARVEQNVIQNTNLAMKRIAYEVRNATGINSVASQSMSLSTSDATRNPVVIGKNGNKLSISWGGGTACGLATPCDLTSNDVTVSAFATTNMSDGASKSASIKYTLTISAVNINHLEEWAYSKTATGSAEIMGK